MNNKKIEVVPYDPNWPEIFEIEKTIILEALGEDCEAIYHVGSTSVPGLAAKPKIDIIVVAKNRVKTIINLEKAGYSYKGEYNIPLQCFFTKRDSHDVNLKYFRNHPEVELNLLFRDYLRANPKIRDEYAAIKMQILQDESSQQRVGKMSMPVYTIRKSNFINSILKKIGFNRLRVLKCIIDDEWNAAKKVPPEILFR